MKKIQYGFTLLELMVTVAIVGIIATIALWNSSDMLEENRAENFLLELKRNISYARAQAASTDEVVIVCPVQYDNFNNKNIELQCKEVWDENKIIIVFIEKLIKKEDKENKSATYESSEDFLLRVMKKISLTDKVKYTGDEKMLRFNTSGRITTSPGDFIYCPNSDNENNKALTVSQSGTAFYLGDTSQKCS